jgi:hypothetical protein
MQVSGGSIHELINTKNSDNQQQGSTRNGTNCYNKINHKHTNNNMQQGSKSARYHKSKSTSKSHLKPLASLVSIGTSVPRRFKAAALLIQERGSNAKSPN